LIYKINENSDIRTIYYDGIKTLIHLNMQIYWKFENSYSYTD